MKKTKQTIISDHNVYLYCTPPSTQQKHETEREN